MAIVPMKFVSACTDRDHLDEMLLKVRTCGLLHPVSASQIVTEDNGGQLLNEDNPYSGYRQTIRNLAHSIGCEIKEN
ncbi:MAG: ATPase V, partial [Stecheria intestinalis]|nr:ATPase V [Stecheria intestinalis]